jgi:pimeloyl-ACP methyl ester carboxylesterase
VLLVHGYGTSIDEWSIVHPTLVERGYRVIAYDQRGHGQSTFGSRSLDADVLADDLAAVLDGALDAGERAVLAGHSMGGITILSWMARHLEQHPRVGGILLANTGYNRIAAETTLLPVIPGRLMPRWLARFVLGVRLPWPPVRALRPLVKWRVMQSGSRRDVDFVARTVRTCPPTTRARWALALVELDLPAPRPIGVPVTVFAGTRDRLMPQAHAHRIVAALGSDVRRFEVFDTGHMGNLEARAEFDAELRGLAALIAAQPPDQLDDASA